MAICAHKGAYAHFFYYKEKRRPARGGSLKRPGFAMKRTLCRKTAARDRGMERERTGEGRLNARENAKARSFPRRVPDCAGRAFFI
jgi:hypothetical protein